MLNGVTMERKPFMCSCKSTELVGALNGLRQVNDVELSYILAPYQDSKTDIVLKSPDAENVAQYLAATNGVENLFVDEQVIKAFTGDSLNTYLALKRPSGYEIYQSSSASPHMW